MKPRHIFLLLSFAVSLVLLACGSDADPTPGNGTQLPAGFDSRESPTPGPTPTPASTVTPSLRYPGMALTLEQGDFWEFRWEWSEQSCAQGSGCSSDSDSGTFMVMLGTPRTIGGVEMFEVTVTGPHTADGGAVDFAPGWRYIGADGPTLLVSNGSSAVSVFDASDGEWTGSGFFSRFSAQENHVANPAAITDAHEFASWPGVVTGPAVSVVRSDSQSNCEIIEGRRICPNDSSFSLSETQYYREGGGPFGYNYRVSASFSGGGFFSSNSSEETVALVASSLRGDTIAPPATPTSPAVRPPPLGVTPTPEVSLTTVFGPQDGSLTLLNVDNQIPDFDTGVNLQEGVVEVTFVNPDVGGGNWSYGVTFRHSEEEKFNAIYVTSSGTWGFFARKGTPEDQLDAEPGTVALNTGVGEENRLTVLFGTEGVSMFVNGELAVSLELPPDFASEAGDVRVLAGLLASDTYNGAESEFRNLTVLAP